MDCSALCEIYGVDIEITVSTGVDPDGVAKRDIISKHVDPDDVQKMDTISKHVDPEDVTKRDTLTERDLGVGVS